MIYLNRVLFIWILLTIGNDCVAGNLISEGKVNSLKVKSSTDDTMLQEKSKVSFQFLYDNRTIKISYLWIKAGNIQQITSTSVGSVSTTLKFSGKLITYSRKEKNELDKVLIKKLGQDNFIKVIKPLQNDIMCNDLLSNITFDMKVKVTNPEKNTTLFVQPVQKILFIECGTVINEKFVKQLSIIFPTKTIDFQAKIKIIAGAGTANKQ